jgi:hypothetical protein
VRMKSRKVLLQNRQYQLHKHLTDQRSIHTVYLCSPHQPDDMCMAHSVNFIKAIMKQGDHTMDKQDSQLKADFIKAALAESGGEWDDDEDPGFKYLEYA